SLDLYLLMLAASSGGAYDVRRPAGMWARTLSGGTQIQAASVSKILRRLESLRLIQRQRVGRLVQVTMRHESGLGLPYTRPGLGHARGEHFIKLDHAYWSEKWHEKLTLPGKAMLLIAL